MYYPNFLKIVIYKLIEGPNRKNIILQLTYFFN